VSARAALRLAGKGLTRVAILEGGVEAWAREGYPIESTPPATENDPPRKENR